jgi:CHAT domain-containing protein/tetratricopeptide (TPR) repeat protein
MAEDETPPPSKEELQDAAEEEFAQEDYDAAGEKFWELAQIANQEGDQSMEMTCYKNIGTCLIYLEEANEALHHWHKALQIAEEIEDVPNQIDLVNKLGALFEQHGEHHRAIGCLNKLLQIHHDQGDKDAELAVLGSLASISYETEDYAMAVKHYEEILEKAIELEDRELQGKVYSNLGTAHQELENVETAQENYQKSLDIALEVSDKLMESRAYSNLADLHSMNGDYEDSATYYKKTIELCKELEGTFEKAKGDTEDLSEDDIAVLEADCDQKITMCKDTQGKAYADLAAVNHELGHSATAMEDMVKAIELADVVGDKQAEGERLTQLAALKMYGNEEVDNAECQGLLEKSIGVWRQYAVALRQQLLQDLENEDIENPDLANTRAAQFFEEHASTYASLQKVLVAQDKDKEALVVAEEGRTQALYDLLQLTGDAAPVDPETSPMTHEEIAQLAQDHDVSIVVFSMVEADRTLYIWVCTPSGEIKFSNINIEELLAQHDTSLSQSVRQLYETMAAAAKSSLCRGPRDNREEVDAEEAPAAPSPDAEIPELQHLYTALIGPIKEQLDPAKDTIFVPHGVLSLVPFTALRDGSGTPLVATHPVSTAPSARVLRTMLARGNGLETDAALVVGNPVTLPQYELQAIPGSEAEASKVAELTGDQCQLLTGDAARMQKVAATMQNVSMVHFACHSQPGILVFAPTLPNGEEEEELEDEDDEPEYDDGLLHKEHVHCLRLMAKPTVVLSGSYTAAGSITEDGIVGLPRAFIAAGAKSVLATMWATQDESAPVLLKAWHEQLKQCGSQAKALQASILALQDQEGGKFKHPVHWAGFTLLGNPTM